MKKILNILTVLIMVCTWCESAKAESPDMAITVFAGNDTTICQNAVLNLADLNASITGDVTNGYWFTSGDGFFNPGGMNNVRFSLGLTYIPGPNDIINGTFDLILVSDDPDGNGPMVQVSDVVKITLQGNVTMVCHGHLNVSLGNDCTETVTSQMLLANPNGPPSQYTVVVKEEDGTIIPNNILTSDHIGQLLTFSVGHICGSNTCWGTLSAQDKTPPVLQCSNFTILCSADKSADAIGLPVSPQATVTKINATTYRVNGIDACGPATLTYQDTKTDLACLNGLQERILRKWTATDGNNNTAMCTQVITIQTIGLQAVVFPPHYDDIQKPALECGGNWPKLPNGHPSPAHTGYPNLDGCKYLEYTFTDIPFDQCGSSFKIWRKWLIVDWCTTQTREYNQIIKIHDSLAPKFKAVDSLKLTTTVYDCFSPKVKIPLISDLEDCSEVDTAFMVRDTFGNKFNHLISRLRDSFYIDSLPVGYYIGSYIVSDACHNKDTVQFPIRVIDDKVPFAVCDQYTKISIITNGAARLFAYSLDDNSIDNCSIARYEIAKMTDLCGGQANQFKEYADYCCAETGAAVMTALRVTDIYGNQNTCMVEVTVEDKEKPIIQCPSHLTISCDYDYDVQDLSPFGKVVLHPSLRENIIIYDAYNNGNAGTDGLATDNCTVEITETYTENIDCYLGQIIRTFTAKDLFGNTASCKQVISVQNPDPFNAGDIIWPVNQTLDGCDTLDADISVTGKPQYLNTQCALVEASYDDQYFFNTSEACVKIIRTWTVIDWCTFDPGQMTGRWDYAQVIKLDNAVAPQWNGTCRDTTFCVFGSDCDGARFTYQIEASDDCTEYQALKWNWEIDLYSDGIKDFSGKTGLVDVLLPLGDHTFFAEVTDQCGNKSTCSRTITTRDCKRPTPYCVSTLTTVIMPSSGNLDIAARQFDFNSFDNCTAKADLKFSFTTQIKDSIRTITCDDIPNGIVGTLMLDMYVIDESGNADYCSVEIIIQDNDDVCPNIGNIGSLSGKVASYKGRNIGQVVLNLSSPDLGIERSEVSDASGNFVFEALPALIPYTLKGIKTGNVREQVSTLDLIVLQRHILGLEKLTSPYQIIAGDANGSGKLNVSDLVAIRKVILGITDQFDAGVPSWRFLDKGFVFDDWQHPWNFSDSIIIENLNNGNNLLDITAVKTGDVNGSIGQFREGENELNYRNGAFDLYVIKTPSWVQFAGENIGDLSGFQLQLVAENVRTIHFHPDLADFAAYFQDGDLIRIVCHLPEDLELPEGEVWFELEAEGVGFGTSRDFSNEVYRSLEATPVRMTEKTETEPPFFNNQLHAVQDGTDILISPAPESGGMIRIFNHQGVLVFSEVWTGQNRIPAPEVQGMYIVVLEQDGRRWTARLPVF